MSKEWQYQVRIDLADEPAEVTRRNAADPALAAKFVAMLAGADTRALRLAGGFED